MQPVSRGYGKLKFALEKFNIDLEGKICADLGSSTGGFVQVILEANCKKVYSVETSKNRLHFVLKDDSRVVVMDKTNALHVDLPEKVDFISVDVGWTKQKLVIPNVVKNLKDNGVIVSLVKPHYESGEKLVKEEDLKSILEKVKEEISEYVKVIDIAESPIVGAKGKNKEFFVLCEKKLK
ncbi:hypothetical protein GOV13_03765 [Candidatus Pacearchaeota archaeon]|nr:hypothetical protein [Candidatus Pacearchaeota archaeon]